MEKPLVLDETEGEALIELASETGRTLMAGHLLQYHPAFDRLKELALSGEPGRVNYIYSHRLNLGKIRREENILWSFAPHDISMILALACEMPETVSATGGNYLHRQIADVTTTHLEFPSGLRAHIFVSWLHPYKEQKLVVVGDKKMAVFDDTPPWPDKLLLYAHKIKWHNNVPVPEKGEAEHVEIPEAEPLRVECEHFLHSFTNGNRPQTDGEEGLRVLKILNAAQRFLNTNGCKVELRTTTAPPPFKTQNSRLKIDSDSGIQSPVLPDTRNLKPETFFAHETAYIDDNVEIGRGTKIWHFSHILKNSRARIVKMDQVRPTRVNEEATLGTNCTIVCGTTIGRYAFVGAGALVNKNVPDHALVVGNPAKQIGYVCVCGERLTDDLECMACNARYKTCPFGKHA